MLTESDARSVIITKFCADTWAIRCRQENEQRQRSSRQCSSITQATSWKKTGNIHQQTSRKLVEVIRSWCLKEAILSSTPVRKQSTSGKSESYNGKRCFLTSFKCSWHWIFIKHYIRQLFSPKHLLMQLASPASCPHQLRRFPQDCHHLSSAAMNAHTTLSKTSTFSYCRRHI